MIAKRWAVGRTTDGRVFCRLYREVRVPVTGRIVRLGIRFTLTTKDAERVGYSLMGAAARIEEGT